MARSDECDLEICYSKKIDLIEVWFSHLAEVILKCEFAVDYFRDCEEIMFVKFIINVYFRFFVRSCFLSSISCQIHQSSGITVTTG